MTNLDRPILFLGPTRSGKSFMSQLLASSPEFAAGFEPITIWNIGMKRRGDDARPAADATPEVVAAIRRNLSAMVESSGAQRYLDDLPHNTLRVPFCRAVLPEARFVCVWRNPADAIQAMYNGWSSRDTLGYVLARRFNKSRRKSIRLSRLPRHGWNWALNFARVRLGLRRRRWGPTVPGQIDFGREHSLVQTVAFQWTQMVRHALEAVESLPPDRIMQMRVEQVMADPVAELTRLTEFCEAREPERIIEHALATLDPARLIPIRTFTDADLREAMEIAELWRLRLNYPDPLAGAPADEDAVAPP